VRAVLELWLKAKSAGEEQVQQQAKEQKTGRTQQRKKVVQVIRCTREEVELSRPYKPVLRLFWADLSRPYKSFSWLSRG
jgi:hypothetical protein